MLLVPRPSWRRPSPVPDCSAVLERLPHAVVRLDGDGRLLHANSAWLALAVATGPVDAPWTSRLSPDGALAAALDDGGAVDLVLRVRAAGPERWLRLRALAGAGERLVVVDDVTGQQRASLVLEHEATVEPLTGLPNRASLLRRLEQAMQPGGRRGALLFVDLDRFKQVNDTLGHQVGDQVLRTVAARLRRTAREADHVARFGGDEFVLLALDVQDTAEAAGLAERVRHAVEQQVWIEGRPVDVGASVGAVLLDQCEDAAEALRVADTLMQRTKRARSGAAREPARSPGRDPLRHTVSFYDDDALVVTEVSDLVGAALLAGRVGLVIATPEHRAAVAARLEARGLDLARAVDGGRYLALDAGLTLQSLLHDGAPDAALFERVVGTQVRRVLDAGDALDAYGEMVSLLWQRGAVAEALSLEDLWNGLQDELAFRLHCAYAVDDALAPPDAHGMHPVCVRHSHVL